MPSGSSSVSALSVRRAALEAEELYTACEYDFNTAAETVRFYRQKITAFLRWAQANGLASVNGDAVRAFFRHLKDTKHSEGGRHAYLRALRTWFNFLRRRKVIGESPLADADIRIAPRTLERPILPKAEQLHGLLAAMRTDVFRKGRQEADFVRLRDYALTLFVLESGARRREALVDVGDVDLQFGTAQTVQKVRRHATTRPLFFPSIRHLVRFYMEERQQVLQSLGKEDVTALWVSDDGEPLTPGAMSQIFKRIKRRYRWDGRFHPHRLRADAATMAAFSGDRTRLELMMGWAPGTPVARRYLNLAGEMQAAAESMPTMSPLRMLARLRRPQRSD